MWGVIMERIKLLIYVLLLALLSACGGGSGTTPSADDDTARVTYDGTDVAEVLTGANGKVIITSSLSGISYEIQLTDESSSQVAGIEILFREDGENAFVYALDPLGTYSDAVFIGTAAELESAMTKANIEFNIILSSIKVSTVGFTTGAYDLKNGYVGDIITDSNWTTGCYTPTEIPTQMQNLYQDEMADSSSIFAFKGTGADTDLQFVKFASAMIESGVGSALTERLEAVFGTSSGELDSEYFQLSCYSSSPYDQFGMMCEVSRGASACDEFNQENTAPVISGTPSTEAISGTEYSFKPTATDADGDALIFSIINRPAWATFDTSTGTLKGTPSDGNIGGSYTGIVIGVSDGEDSASLTSFSIDVIAVPIVQIFEVLKTGQAASYETNDDGDYKKGLARGYTRDGVNNIVTDNTTGLVWQDDAVVSSTHRSWADAVTYCDGLSLGGYSDWRLPTMKELTTIIDYGASPAMDGIFANVGGSYYWSSTEYFYKTDQAWSVYFQSGYDNHNTKTNATDGYVRCVR